MGSLFQVSTGSAKFILMTQAWVVAILILKISIFTVPLQTQINKFSTSLDLSQNGRFGFWNNILDCGGGAATDVLRLIRSQSLIARLC